MFKVIHFFQDNAFLRETTQLVFLYEVKNLPVWARRNFKKDKVIHFFQDDAFLREINQLVLLNLVLDKVKEQ